jgi:hypothetical protein
MRSAGGVSGVPERDDLVGRLCILCFRLLRPAFIHRSGRSGLKLDEPLPFREVIPVLFGKGLRFVADCTSVLYQSSPLGDVFEAIKAPYEFQKFDLQQGKLLHLYVPGSPFRGILHQLNGLSVGVLL